MIPLRTSIATVCLAGDLREKLAAISAAGFDGIEIFEQDFIAFEHGAREVARMAADQGLEITLFQPFRDFEGIGELDMPAYCAGPSAPTNLTKHEAMERNIPVACGGVAVFPGDVLVGDGDGVMVIPAHLADEIAEVCSGMESFEAFVLEEVLAGTPIIGLYPCTKEENQRKFEDWQRERGQ